MTLLRRMIAPAPADQARVLAAPLEARPTLRPRPSAVPSAATEPTALVALASIPVPAWEALATRAVEPNACYLPLWALPVANFARGRHAALALAAFKRAAPDRLTGLLPVRWARQALSLPLPLLVSWNAYAPFSVPLLDRDAAAEAADALVDGAKAAGAHALLLQTIATGGPAYTAIMAALERRGLTAQVMRGFRRAGLDATRDGDAVLHAALSPKKLKELRRQRNRLGDAGDVTFKIAVTPDCAARALEDFLALEARGWKGRRGTALVQDAGDAAFIRQAVPALAARGQCQVVSLLRNGQPLASGLILRDGGRAFFFKIAMDEQAARMSPGVQLTLDLTKYLCADPTIAFADSTADGEHPMIDHIWRERVEIVDLFIPLSPRDPVAAAIRAAVAARYRGIDLVKALRRIKEKLP